MTSNQSHCWSVELKSGIRHLTKNQADCLLWARANIHERKFQGVERGLLSFIFHSLLYSLPVINNTVIVFLYELNCLCIWLDHFLERWARGIQTITEYLHQRRGFLILPVTPLRMEMIGSETPVRSNAAHCVGLMRKSLSVLWYNVKARVDTMFRQGFLKLLGSITSPVWHHIVKVAFLKKANGNSGGTCNRKIT